MRICTKPSVTRTPAHPLHKVTKVNMTIFMQSGRDLDEIDLGGCTIEFQGRPPGGAPTLREHVTGRQRRKVHLTFRRSTSQLRPLFLSTRSGRKMGAEGGERERRWETPKAKIFTIERVALVCPCPPRQRRRKEEEPRRRKRGPSQVPSA